MRKIPLVVKGLGDKRAEIVAEIEWLQKRLERREADLAKVEGALELWEEGKWVRGVRRAYRENPGPFKWRELPRLIIEVLRAADRPLTNAEIQERVYAAKGIVAADAKDRYYLSRRVTGAINDQKRQGKIAADGKIADRLLWRLVEWPPTRHDERSREG